MSFGKYVLGAVIGGAIGAAVGILLAPRSGVETREMIREELSNKYNDTKEQVETRLDRINDQISDKTELLKSKANEIGDRVKQISEDLEERGRKAFTQLTASGRLPEGNN